MCRIENGHTLEKFEEIWQDNLCQLYGSDPAGKAASNGGLRYCETIASSQKSNLLDTTILWGDQMGSTKSELGDF
jgi:hypothetical protein